MVRDCCRTAAAVEWCLLVGLAVGLAACAAKPFAAGWNDGSRLATVECLIDHHTFNIDESIFVRPFPRTGPPRANPYDPSDPGLELFGTQDRMWIGGHFYSDKSPTSALLMAAGYQVWQWLTGATAAQQPESFCRTANLASAGFSYVVCVVCLFVLCRRLGVSVGMRWLLVASFGLGTVALPYAAHVNNHILLLAIVFMIVLQLQALAERREQGVVSSRWSWLLLGLATGLGYTIDLGVGPVLLVTTTGWVVFTGRGRALLPFFLGAIPWLALHHAVNYAIGGTFRPANANPEFFDWPGSPFNATNITGVWHHDALSLFLHGGNMLVGRRGFLFHNLPLLLAALGAGFLLRHVVAERAVVLWAAAVCGGSWLLYTASSQSTGGLCLSIRWFVPFLAPGYYVLVLYLRRCPERLPDLALLSGWGTLLITQVGFHPWRGGSPPHYWPIVGAALVCWSALRLYLRRGRKEIGNDEVPLGMTQVDTSVAA